MQMNANLYQQVRAALDAKFVFADEPARILSLALAGQKNVIIYGPGGHGKSAMVSEVVHALGLEGDTFFQFFGEGMDESRLYGGLNFKKLEDEKVLEYYPEKSFLNSRVAVFEELFDAPASVLLALKDTLTARCLRNGSQVFPMKTELVICLTNKEPSEISELGAAAHALVERFPLQMDLRWKDYSAKSYLSMFEKVAQAKPGPVLNGFRGILAEIIAKASAEGNFVSPRTAVHAYEVCQTAAVLRGADHVGQEDLTDLRFVPGLEGLAETIQADLAAAMERAEAEKAFAACEVEFTSQEKEFGEANTPIRALQSQKKFMALGDKLDSLKCPDGLTDRRKKLRQLVTGKVSEAQKRALDTTRV
ncbi:AAA family ATPase [Candidatus Kaiserbacteria bacterium]|nr:AAA family ATPase [Candidatus Kaiserbacteria bacterium]